MNVHGEQCALRAVVEKAFVCQRSRRDRTNQLSFHQTFARGTELLADADTEALIDQTDQILIQRHVGNAGHWDTSPGVGGRTRSQRQPEHSMDEFGVFEKSFVEVAHSIHDQ